MGFRSHIPAALKYFNNIGLNVNNDEIVKKELMINFETPLFSEMI